jgi:hypothetical protein
VISTVSDISGSSITEHPLVEVSADETAPVSEKRNRRSRGQLGQQVGDPEAYARIARELFRAARNVTAASLAELELELGRERRAAAREARRSRGQHIGRPKALDKSKAALAQRMHTSGESASTIATALGVSRATVYRVLAEQTAEGD